MELMNKEAVYSGSMKIRDPVRWPLDCDASKFVQSAESAYSIDELKQVRNLSIITAIPLNCPKQLLFTRKTTKADIIDLKTDVYMAEFSVFRGYNICV